MPSPTPTNFQSSLISASQTLASAGTASVPAGTHPTTAAQPAISGYTSATLSAASLSLWAHTSAPANTGTQTGDTLISSTLGYDSLFSSLGADSLYSSGSNDLLVAGSGKDTLTFAGTNGVASLSTFTAVTLNASAASGTTVYADSIGAATVSLVGGASTVAGGTLVITNNAATLADTAFGKVSKFNVLSLTGTGSTAVVLGANAQAAGINNVYGGKNGTAFTQTSTLATTLVGGSGNDLFAIGTSAILAADSIVGGAGSDTLALAAAATLPTANAFAKVSGIEVLSLTGASAVTLDGSAQTTGILTVVGGAGAKNAGSTLTQTAGDTLATMLLGGAGTDLFSVTSSQLTSDTITGGGGKDTLVLSTAGTVTDSAFAKVSGIGTLSLTSSSNITLDTNVAAAGITLVSAGSAGDTLAQTTAFTNGISLAGGIGADYFSLSSSILADSKETINGGGGSGINTLALTDSNAAVADAAFTNHKAIQSLVLGSNSSVILDSKAKAVGIATVYGGNGGATISQTAGDTTASTLIGGSGNDSIAISTALLTSTTAAKNASIIGGSGIDTLSLAVGTKAAAIADTAFGRVKGIEVLSLSGDNLTLGVNARYAGLSTIIAGSTGSITHTVADTNALNLIGGSTSASAPGNTFVEATSAVLAGDTITGGAGIDTLVISSQGNFADTSFAKVSGVEVLSLTGASAIAVGPSIKAAGIATILGGAGGDTFVQASADAFTLNGGAGADSFDLSATALAADSIAGGSGTDTLVLTSAGTFNDSAFSKVSGVEVLSLTSPSSVTLGAAATLAGITSIYAGNGGDTLIQTAPTSKGATFIGGAGNDLVSVATTAILIADSLYAGKGIDTLIVADSAATLTDANFSKAKGFEVLSLNGGTAVLGAGAAAEGFTTVVISGSASQTLNAAAFNGDNHTIDLSSSTGSVSVAGSTNTGTKFLVNGSNLASESLKGGSGSDTLAVVSGAAVDSAFSLVSGMDVLSLGAASVVLGSAFDATGITKVVGGTGSSTIAHDVSSTLGYLIDGRSSSAADLFSYDYASLAAKDTVYGSSVTGSAGDTLAINSDTYIADSVYTAFRGVEVLSLSGANTVELGTNASNSSFGLVLGGDQTTFTQSAGTKGFTLDGSAGSKNVFALANASLLTSDTLLGSGSDDTLTIGAAATISDSLFANETLGANLGINALVLTGSSSATLGNNASLAGIQSVFGGTGNDSFSETTLGNFTFDGGAGSNTLRVTTGITDSLDGSIANIQTVILGAASDVTLNAAGVQTVIGSTASDMFTEAASSLAAIQIYGGGASTLGDTLALATALTSNDSFSALHSIANLQLADASNNVTLGSGAAAAGIHTVWGGASTLGSAYTEASLAAFNIQGDSSAVDTLNLTNVLTSLNGGNDGFGSLANISVLNLANGNNAVTLGDKAMNTAGILTVVGGTGNNSFNESNAAFDAISIHGGSGNNTLTVSDGLTDSLSAGGLINIQTVILGAASDVTLNAAGVQTVIGSTASDMFTEAASSLGAFQIYGGGASTLGDTVNVIGALTSNDAFSALHNIASVQLDDATNNVTIGSAASAAGIQTIFGGTGNNNFTEASLGGVGIAGNSDSLHATSITLTSAVTQDDSAFANISGVKNLQLTGLSTVTLSANADNSGIVNVIGGADDISVTQDENSGNSYNINASADTLNSNGGNSFYIAYDSLLSGDTVSGSANGTDTLILGDDTFNDTSFSNISNVAVVALAGPNATAEIDLGSTADNVGFTSVVGTGGDDTFNQTADAQNAYLFDGSADQSNLFQFGYAYQAAKATVLGGQGNDTLLIGADNVTDDAFQNVTNVGNLQLTGSSSVVLSSNADGSGIQNVYGGNGDSTFIQDSFSINGYNIDGSAGNSNLFQIDNASQAAGDTFVGSGNTATSGLGMDTLQILEGSIADSAFKNVSLGGSAPSGVLQLTGSQDVTLSANADQSGVNTILGGSGDSTITQDYGSTLGYYVDGSAGTSNLISVDNGTQLANDTINGGTGNDTIVVGEDSIQDVAFANVSNVVELQLTGTTFVDLGSNADAAGFLTVTGGSGDTTISQDGNSSNPYYFDGILDSSNLFQIDSSTLAAGDTFAGAGNGNDTLQIMNGSVTDDAFTNLAGVAYLQLTGSQDVTLSANADASGVSTIAGGAGDDTVTQDGNSTGSYFFDGSSNTSNLFVIDNATLASGDTFAGAGHGLDTLEINQAALADADVALALTNASGIVLQLVDGGASATLGSGVAVAGLHSVVGGVGHNTLTQTSGDTLATYLDGSAGTNNLYVIDPTVLANDTINGSGGAGSLADTLKLTGSAYDNAFTNVSGIVNLQLTDATAVTLSANADNINGGSIVNVYGGLDDVTITQDANSGGSYNINASADTINSNGGNTFYVDQNSQLGGDTITGSANGSDTLNLGDDTFVDDSFANLSGIAVVQLAGPSATGEIDLGSNADNSGLSSVVGSGGNATFYQTADAQVAYLFDGSADQSNVFAFDNAYQAAQATVLGGAGNDTLQVNNGDNLDDTTFQGVSNVTNLQLGGSSSVELGSNADGSGIVNVYGGSGDSTFVQNSFSINGYNIDGSASNSNLFQIDNAAQAASDTFVGSGNTATSGLGLDTLTILNGSVTDGAFTNASFGGASASGVLQLLGSQDVTLSSHADQSGIVTILGGKGDSTITQDGVSTLGYYVDGSAGTSNLISVDNSTQLSNDTINGGTNNDTLVVGEDSIQDVSFANVSNVAVLQLTGTSFVDIGSNADYAGFLTISGGTGDTTISQDSNSSNPYYLDGTQDSSNLFQVDSSSLASYNTFAGAGNGNDTLQIMNGSVTDDAFGNLTGVGYLQLTGSQDVTLSANADASGLGTIVGGAGDDTITQDGNSTGNYFFDGTSSSSNLFVIDNATLASGDTFAGGTGNDTLAIANSDTLTDNAFANFNGIEVLQLTGDSNAVLGSNAQTAGFTSATAGNGTDTIDLSGWNATTQHAAFTLNGGSGADNFILGAGSSNAFGNTGTDIAYIKNWNSNDTLSVAGYSDSGASEYSLQDSTLPGFAEQLYNTSTNNVVAYISSASITTSNLHFV
jgi:hypothetical protein